MGIDGLIAKFNKFFYLSFIIFLVTTILKADEKIPFRMSAGKIYVDGKANYDSHKINCILDSGSTESFIDLSEILEATRLQEKTCGQGITGQFKDLQSVGLAMFQVGGIEKENFKMLVSDYNTGNIDCLVGVNFFPKQNLSFYFDKSEIWLSPYPEAKLRKEPLSISKGLWLIPIKIGDKECKALWDTGGGISVIASDIAKNQSGFTENGTMRVDTFSFLHSKVLPKYNMEKLEFGNKVHENFDVIASDSLNSKEFCMIIGMDIIKNYNWFFNQTDSPPTWIVSDR